MPNSCVMSTLQIVEAKGTPWKTVPNTLGEAVPLLGH